MSSKRIITLYSFILFSIAALTLRVYFVSQGGIVSQTAQNFNSYRISVSKSRGVIYDRNMTPLVENEKRYAVSVLPSVQSRSYLHSVLSEDVFLSIQDKFTQGKPFSFFSDKYIAESGDVKVFLSNLRYSQTPLATHFIGYCDSSLEKGISGIEKAYDSILSEHSGSLCIKYASDATGRSLPGATPEIINDNFCDPAGLVLTIDKKIQKIAQSAAFQLNGNGSILITDVETGEILAGVSIPEYDRGNIAQSIQSEDSSLLNRNLCAYNIGSTYKIIVSAAALSKNISPNFTHNCTGSLTIGDTDFHCHKEQGHGVMNMESAFANSCNPYFVKLGLSVGKERLCSLSAAMGLGSPIELCPGIVTAAGSLPSSDDIKSAGDLANISFGQGALMATPIHIAKIVSAVANGGYLVFPTLTLGQTDDGKAVTQSVAAKERVRIFDAQTSEKIRQYMVTTVKTGTGRMASPAELGAGGKTASAETGWVSGGEELVQAWFSGFYPAEKPKYAIVVLCEGGRSGAASCAPVFKKICDLLYEGGFCE